MLTRSSCINPTDHFLYDLLSRCNPSEKLMMNIIFPQTQFSTSMASKNGYRVTWLKRLYLCFFFKILFIYLCEAETGRDIDRRRSRLPAGSTMWDSIPDPGIIPWAKGRHSTTEPPRCPFISISIALFSTGTGFQQHFLNFGVPSF